MKPVMQTKFGKNQGDCLLACVASLFEMDIKDVPDFTLSGKDWFDDFYEYCKGRGMSLILIHPDENGNFSKIFISDMYAILLFEVIGSEEDHAVIGILERMDDDPDDPEGRIIWESRIYHDPNPNRINLGKLKSIIVPITQNLNNAGSRSIQDEEKKP